MRIQINVVYLYCNQKQKQIMATNAFIGFIATHDETINIQKHNDTLTITKDNYVYVYCHYDGYPTKDGLGGYLHENVKTYEDVKKLVSGGCISYIEDDEIAYYTNMGESWTNNKPISSLRTPSDIDYTYKFENGIWYVSPYGKKFVKLERYLKK